MLMNGSQSWCQPSKQGMHVQLASNSCWLQMLNGACLKCRHLQALMLHFAHQCAFCSNCAVFLQPKFANCKKMHAVKPTWVLLLAPLSSKNTCASLAISLLNSAVKRLNAVWMQVCHHLRLSIAWLAIAYSTVKERWKASRWLLQKNLN